MEDQKRTPGPVVAVKTGRSGKDFERNWRELRTESGRCITWSGEYHSNLYGTVAGVAIQDAARYLQYLKDSGIDNEGPSELALEAIAEATGGAK